MKIEYLDRGLRIFRVQPELSHRLNSPSTLTRTYWATLNTFPNSSRVAIVLHLLEHDENVATRLEKANVLNDSVISNVDLRQTAVAFLLPFFTHISF